MRFQTISGQISTGDPNLACALLTNGVPLDELNPVEPIKSDRGDFLRFHFLPLTVDGKRRTAELCAAWEAGEAHIAKHPEDGMSYCMAFSMNRKSIMDYIHQATPQVLVRKGKQVAMISENVRPGSILESEILGRLR